MSELNPVYTQFDKEIVYDTSVEESQILEVSCDRLTIHDLNSENNRLRFTYPGDFIYYLASQDSGFLIRVAFRTRTNANN